MDRRKKEIAILKITGEGRETLNDQVVQESPLTIYLNDQEFVTLLCTPEKQDYLTLGFLRSEGLIKGREDVLSLEVDEENGMVNVETREPGKLSEKLFGKRTITSGCGKGTIFYNVLDSLSESSIKTEIYLNPETISRLMRDLQDRADLFKTTGGVHSSALGTKEGIVFFCEDIGRHNAVDKLIGECIAEDVSLEDKLLITSGRLSSEILLKAAKIGIPVLLSRAAPTALSVELGNKLGVTMVGFIRGKRMNVYSGEWRITEE